MLLKPGLQAHLPLAEEGLDRGITLRNIRQVAGSSCKRRFPSLAFGFPPWCVWPQGSQSSRDLQHTEALQGGAEPTASRHLAKWKHIIAQVPPRGPSGALRPFLCILPHPQEASAAKALSRVPCCPQGSSTLRQGCAFHTYHVRALKTEGKMSFHFPEDKTKILTSLAGKHCLEKGTKQSCSRNMHRLGSSIPAEPPALTRACSAPACPNPAALSDWHD